MTWYHAAASAISRSKGHTATGIAAYVTGQTMKDEETGIWCKRKHPGDVLAWGTLAPDHAPAWMTDEANLKQVWNSVQSSEKRSNARLATHWNIALYRDADPEQQQEVMQAIAQAVVDRYGCLVTWAVHEPTKHGSGKNAHGHIVLNDRKVTSEGFGEKLGMFNTASGRAEVEWFREMVADKLNAQLERLGVEERVSHESYAARGIDRKPTVHMGNEAFQLELQGIKTEKGDRNRAIRVINLDAERIRRRPMEESEILLNQQREQSEIERLKQHDKDIQAFKAARQKDAEDARDGKKPKGRGPAHDRYTIALGESVSADPYVTMAKAAGREGAMFMEEQKDFDKRISAEKDPFQKGQLKLEKEIQAYEYMALTTQRIAGIGEVIAGRKDHPQVIQDHARAEAYQDKGQKLRQEHQANQEAKEKKEREGVADKLGGLAAQVARGEMSQSLADKLAAAQRNAQVPTQGRASSRGR